ncbi:MAG: hypothetical protein Q9167_007518 [Letrouitia subvulpina]
MDSEALLVAERNKWASHISTLQRTVESKDRNDGSKIGGFEMLLKLLDSQARKKPSLRDPTPIYMLPPALHHIHKLSTSAVSYVAGNSNAQPDLLWGLVGVAVQLSLTINKALLGIFAETIKDAGDHAQILVEYESRALPTEHLRSAMVNMKIEIDKFVAAFVKNSHDLEAAQKDHCRPHDLILSNEVCADASIVNSASALESTSSLEELNRIAQKSLTRIKNITSSIQIIAQIFDLKVTEQTFPYSRSPTLAGIDASYEAAALSCTILPTPRNPRFFGRSAELKTIDLYLRASTAPGLRALAIHGMGGVGKTQTALAYAWGKVNEYDLVCWLHAETEIALASSLGDLARQLKLAQISPGNNTSNALLVIEWLQQTTRTWLLVYDNAEKRDFLAKFWPKSGHGAILATTRNRTISPWLCTSKYQINIFSPDEGARFLLHMMAAQNLDIELPSTEMKVAANELSVLVGGHALALTQIVALITSRQWSLQEFLLLYRTRPKAIHGITPDGGIDSNYKFFINTVFKEAFSNFSVDEALEPLLRLALAKKDSKGLDFRRISLHRLVQNEFSFFIEEAERQKLFEHACLLLYYAFPQRVAARFLHSRWPECELYIQHVVAILDAYINPGELPRLRPTIELCFLLSSSACFLAKAFRVFDDCGIESREPMHYARLHMSAGVMWDNLGHFNQSLDEFSKCLQICQTHLKSDDEFLGGIYNDLGNVSESLGQWKDAIDWHKKAWEIRAKTDDPTQENVAHSKSNKARSLLMLNQDDEAGRLMEDAGAVFGHASAWFHEAQGNLYRKQGLNALAMNQYNISLRLLLDKVKAPHHVRASSCYYKLGSIAIEEGDINLSIEYLRQALSICEIRTQNVGDRARVLNKLSQALSRSASTEEEALEKGAEALRLYREKVPKNNVGDELIPSDFDYDIYVGANE